MEQQNYAKKLNTRNYFLYFIYYSVNCFFEDI